MPSRHRENLELYTGYRIKNSNGSLSYRSMNALKEFIDDTTGPGDNAPLTISKIRLSGGLINGKENDPQLGYDWHDCPCHHQIYDSGVYSHRPTSTLGNSLAASTLLRRTTPERPSTQALVAIWEAREIPGLLKELYESAAGKLYKHIPSKTFKFLGRAAKLNILIKFGLAPIFSDLSTLLDFQSLVDKRVKELERFRSPRGIRRTVELDTDEVDWTSTTQTVQSSDVYLTCKYRKHTREIVRGHIRWYLDQNYELSDSTIRLVARKAILGAYLDPSTLYEAMPWSWLIDYFYNLGDFVAATRNSLAAHHNTPRIMRYKRTNTTSFAHTTSNGGKVTFTPLNNVYETKTRVLATASLTARHEFLTGSQTSILGSLAVLKGLKGLR